MILILILRTGLIYAMEHGFSVHFRGKFRGEMEGLKIKAVLFSRSQCSAKVPNNLVSIIISHLILTHQLSPELNSNFAICNIYPNREPKDFSKKKKRPKVNNLAAIKCSSPFKYNVIDEENDQNPKGRQKFPPCFQTTK